MKYYFALLNWVALVAIVLSIVYLHPLLATWWIVAGVVLGAMMTAGYITLRFYGSYVPMKERDEAWCTTFFRKKYGKEVLFHSVITLFFLLPSLCGVRFFYVFVGISGMWLTNVLIEWAWAFFHRNNETYFGVKIKDDVISA